MNLFDARLEEITKLVSEMKQIELHGGTREMAPALRGKLNEIKNAVRFCLKYVEYLEKHGIV